MTTKKTNNSLLQSLKKLKPYRDEIGFKELYLLASAFFSLLAALFETVSLGLLIPVTQGFFESNFEFLKSAPLISRANEIIPGIFDQPTSNIFIILFSVVLITAVLKSLSTYTSVLILEYQIARLGTGMRKLIFRKYLELGKMFFDKNSIGHLNQILLGFTDVVTNKLQNATMCISSLFLLIAYLAVLFLISWKLTLFSLIIFPALFSSLKWIVIKIEKSSRAGSEAKLELNKKIANILLCIPLVKAYSKEKKEVEEFSRISDAQSMIQYSISKKEDFIRTFQEIFTMIASLLLVVVIVFFLINKGQGNAASYLIYLIFLRRSMAAFSELNAHLATFVSIADPLARIVAILEDQNQFTLKEGTKKFEGLKNQIEFRNLTFSYDRKEILKDVSFCLKKGKMTAIVGPTGSGKSTLMNLLLRFYDCESGMIFIDDNDILELNSASLRSRIALVSQDALVFHGTIKDNILYGIDRDVPQEELEEICKKAQILQFINSLPQKFETLVGDRGVLLSGGEKQRLSIARALLKRAEILFFDEATSALDSHTEKLIQEAIQAAVIDRTSLVIAHRLSTLRKSDYIIVLEKGSVVEEGTLKMLLELKGKFYSYWQEQNDLSAS